MTDHPQPTNHFVIFPFSERSHIRALVNFHIDLLAVHSSAVVTAIASSVGRENLQKELDLHDPTYLRSIGYAERFRVVVVEVGDVPRFPPNLENQAMQDEMEKSGLLQRMWAGEEGEGRWRTRPCFVAIDVFRHFVRSYVHSVNARLDQPQTPVWKFFTGFAPYLPILLMPEAKGGFYDGCGERFERYKASGMDEKEAVIKAARHASGKLLRYPSLPEMYDYEISPQVNGGYAVDAYLCHVYSEIYKNMYDCDGIFDLGVAELDDPARVLIRELTGKPSAGVGLQDSRAPVAQSATREQDDSSEEDNRILSFLDKAADEYGPRCAIYISFGSYFWPALRPAVWKAIVDALLELKDPMPFVLATAGPAAEISPDYAAKIEQSGRGIVTKWAPQVKILNHTATAGFVTHAGAGSIRESISAGVPMIYIPFALDQVPNAMHFSVNNPVGIMVYQVASGCDGEPRANGPTINSTPETMQAELSSALTALRGDKGAGLRDQVAAVRQTFRDSADHGQAKQAVLDLERFFTA